jgi:hypothetical protein
MSKDKVKYVLEEMKKPVTEKHHCHWPGCQVVVSPAMWGCRSHWFRIPIKLRSAVWMAYRPGQEKTKTPSKEYVQAARAVLAWILDRYPETRKVKARNG